MIAEELKLVVTAEVTKALANMHKVQTKTNQLKNAFNDLKRYAMAGFSIAGIVAIGKAAFDAALELGRLGAEFSQVHAAFSNMARLVGADADDVIASLSEMAGETVSKMDLMRSASTASLLGLPVDELDKLMRIARASATATGQDVRQMFDDIVRGIGRASPLILDNLGITVKIGTATKIYAESIGKTVAQLTAAEKKQAVLNAVLKDGERIMYEVGKAGQEVTDLERWQQATAAIADMKTELGLLLNQALVPTVEIIGAELRLLLSDLLYGWEDVAEAMDVNVFKADIDTLKASIHALQWAMESFGEEHFLSRANEGVLAGIPEKLKIMEHWLKVLTDAQNKNNAASKEMIDLLLPEELDRIKKSYEAMGGLSLGGGFDPFAGITFDKPVPIFNELEKKAESIVNFTSEMGDHMHDFGQIVEGIDMTPMTEMEEVLESIGAQIELIAENMQGVMASAIVSVSEAMGEALVTGADMWESFGDAAKNAIALILEALAKEFAVLAVAALAKAIGGEPSQLVAAALYGAAAIAAGIAAGAVKAMDAGGWINEPVIGRGMRSGRPYAIAEKGPEYLIGRGQAAGQTIVINNYIRGSHIADRELGRTVIKSQRQAFRGH